MGFLKELKEANPYINRIIAISKYPGLYCDGYSILTRRVQKDKYKHFFVFVLDKAASEVIGYHFTVSGSKYKFDIRKINIITLEYMAKFLSQLKVSGPNVITYSDEEILGEVILNADFINVNKIDFCEEQECSKYLNLLLRFSHKNEIQTR